MRGQQVPSPRAVDLSRHKWPTLRRGVSSFQFRARAVPGHKPLPEVIFARRLLACYLGGLPRPCSGRQHATSGRHQFGFPVDSFTPTLTLTHESRSSPSSPSTFIYVVPWSEFPIVPSYSHYPQSGRHQGDSGRQQGTAGRQHETSGRQRETAGDSRETAGESRET